jgi:lactoylglutathione lyase
MSRVQLALNVDDLEAAVSFYEKLFDTPPAKVRPGYANFAVSDPPLKLVLIESPSAPPGSLNHLGVETASSGEVAAARQRLDAAGLVTDTEEHVACCYALQDKVWVHGTAGESWEIYTVLDDAETPPTPPGSRSTGAAACCGVSRPGAAPAPPSCC